MITFVHNFEIRYPENKPEKKNLSKLLKQDHTVYEQAWNMVFGGESVSNSLSKELFWEKKNPFHIYMDSTKLTKTQRYKTLCTAFISNQETKS